VTTPLIGQIDIIAGKAMVYDGTQWTEIVSSTAPDDITVLKDRLDDTIITVQSNKSTTSAVMSDVTALRSTITTLENETRRLEQERSNMFDRICQLEGEKWNMEARLDQMKQESAEQLVNFTAMVDELRKEMLRASLERSIETAELRSELESGRPRWSSLQLVDDPRRPRREQFECEWGDSLG
jgi:predicted RNase H-like nuclease (RuvC/YqgF family)